MKSIVRLFDRIIQRILPDPFIIAIFLTVATLIWAYFSQPLDTRDGLQIVGYWGDGFWSLAAFTLQMAMILIGGYVVATSGLVQQGLRRLISFVNTPIAAVLFCTFTSMMASWINWGFGLVVGAVVAVEVGKKLSNVPFRVLVASSYSGFLVWHAGLSGSIPLLLNSEGKLSSELIGETIALSQTTFGTLNLVALAAMVLVIPLVNLYNLNVCADEQSTFVPEETKAIDAPDSISGNWLNRSWIPVLLLVGLALAYWYGQTTSGAFKLDLNTVIMIFFMLGLLLHGSPSAFIDSVTEATPKIAPILIQYPLYAAIMAVLKQSGLAHEISQWFVENSTQTTFPLMTFYSAGLLNLLVPSGGGQWAVQADIVIGAARELNVPLPKVAMAVAWGDAWTNMAQPFWAIPLLTIAGLKIKDIMGFCLITLFVSGAALSLIFLVL